MRGETRRPRGAAAKLLPRSHRRCRRRPQRLKAQCEWLQPRTRRPETQPRGRKPGAAAQPPGRLGPDRSDKVDRRFPPCQLRPPGHIPEKPDSPDAEQGAGQAGARRHGLRAEGRAPPAPPPPPNSPPARAAPLGRGRGSRPATGSASPRPPPPRRPRQARSRHLDELDGERRLAHAASADHHEPVLLLAGAVPPAGRGHGDAAEPARPRRAAARPRPGSGDVCGRRAAGERRAGVPGAGSCREGRSGRQRGARAGRVPPEARRSRRTAGARGGSGRGARAPPHVSAAPAEHCLQRRYKWPSGGRAARLRCCICMRGRGGAGPRWPGLRLRR